MVFHHLDIWHLSCAEEVPLTHALTSPAAVDDSEATSEK